MNMTHEEKIREMKECLIDSFGKRGYTEIENPDDHHSLTDEQIYSIYTACNNDPDLTRQAISVLPYEVLRQHFPKTGEELGKIEPLNQLESDQLHPTRVEVVYNRDSINGKYPVYHSVEFSPYSTGRTNIETVRKTLLEEAKDGPDTHIELLVHNKKQSSLHFGSIKETLKWIYPDIDYSRLREYSEEGLDLITFNLDIQYETGYRQRFNEEIELMSKEHRNITQSLDSIRSENGDHAKCTLTLHHQEGDIVINTDSIKDLDDLLQNIERPQRMLDIIDEARENNKIQKVERVNHER